MNEGDEVELVVRGGSDARQIAEQVRALITAGRLSAGEELPTVRELAVELVVNPTVIQHAYDLLQEEGYLTTAEGSGAFAACPAETKALPPGREGELKQLCQEFLTHTELRGFGAADVLETLRQLVNQGEWGTLAPR
jgi:GntR family transcriptional regulator